MALSVPVDSSISVMQAPAVLSQQLADELVLFDPNTGRSAVLDELGAVVWECLAAPVSLDVLATEIAEAFAVDRDVALAGSSQLIDELARSGLLCEGAAS